MLINCLMLDEYLQLSENTASDTTQLLPKAKWEELLVSKRETWTVGLLHSQKIQTHSSHHCALAPATRRSLL